ncbi:hypothetical protein [Magnetococcus sp. PR-3]|uniref:hypothetical protein n=1 Tax=Magnetococcus sp. PR-3 TaxID=3120355 RepID=UPI002FCDF6A3
MSASTGPNFPGPQPMFNRLLHYLHRRKRPQEPVIPFSHLQENAEQRRHRMRRTSGLLVALVILLVGLGLVLWVLLEHLVANPHLALIGGGMVFFIALLNAWLIYRLIRGTPPSGIERGKLSFIHMGWNWAWNYLVISLRGEIAFVEPTRKQVDDNRQTGFAGILTSEMVALNTDERIEGDHWHAYMEELEQADHAYHEYQQTLEEQFEQEWDDTLPRETAPPEPPETEDTEPSAPSENEQEQEEPVWVQRRVSDLEAELDASQQAYDEELDAVYTDKSSASPAQPKTTQPEEALPSPEERLREFLPQDWPPQDETSTNWDTPDQASDDEQTEQTSHPNDFFKKSDT